MEKTRVIYYDFIKLLTEVGGFYGAISSIFAIFSMYFMRKCFKKDLLSYFYRNYKDLKNENDAETKMKYAFSFENIYEMTDQI